MADYGHDLEFGYFLIPTHEDTAGTLELARSLDGLGYDLIGIQDHPYQRNYFDTMALIATILAQTERVKVFPDVANLPLRPPVMLAKTAASLDQLSGGRFELGLGAGAFWQAITAMGGPERTPGEAVETLTEAIAILRAMWSGQRSVRFEGKHYRARGVQPGPLPAHDIGIWLGVNGQRTLKLTGQVADGWVPSMPNVPPDQTTRGHALIDAAAREAGRDPSAIRRIYNISGSFSLTAPQPATDSDKQIIGPVEHWVAVLTHLTLDFGFSSFVLWAEPDPETLRLFINEVAPVVREEVANRRSNLR